MEGSEGCPGKLSDPDSETNVACCLSYAKIYIFRNICDTQVEGNNVGGGWGLRKRESEEQERVKRVKNPNHHGTSHVKNPYLTIYIRIKECVREMAWWKERDQQEEGERVGAGVG